MSQRSTVCTEPTPTSQAPASPVSTVSLDPTLLSSAVNVDHTALTSAVSMDQASRSFTVKVDHSPQSSSDNIDHTSTLSMDCSTLPHELAGSQEGALTSQTLTSQIEALSEGPALKLPRHQDVSDDRDQSAECAALHLNIETQEELQEFLREIHEQFVSMVVPRNMALWDKLLGESLVTRSDYSSLDGKHVHTRAEQARKLWLLLHKLSVEDFKTKVFPDLSRDYPHIVPTSSHFFTPHSHSPRVRFPDPMTCLHHELIRQVRPVSMADCFYKCKGITLDCYRELVSDASLASMSQLWSRLFKVLRDHDPAVSSQLKMGLEDVLRHNKMAVPHDLEQQIKQGVPCICKPQQHNLPHGGMQVEEETGEVDSSTNGQEEVFKWCDQHQHRLFESPGSQYLGSDDPSLCLSSLDPEFTKWARNEGLSEGTLLMLLREGLASKEDLARLRVEEVEEYLPHYSALQGKQKLELKKVIRELSSQSDTRPASYPASPPCLSSLLDEGEVCRLLVMGKTGSGKSHSCNTLLGDNKFSYNLSMGSHTKDFQFEQSDNHRLQVMDFPGLFDTSMLREEVCTIIVQALVAMHPDPSAVLYTLKIGDHYTDEEFQTFQNLKRIFGEDMCRHTIVLLTHGDALKRAGKTREQYIQESPERFKQVLRECGSRYVVLDNTDPASNKQQLQKLHDMVREMMDRADAGHLTLPPFSRHKEEIAAEIRRRLHCNPEGGEFGAKCNFMKDGSEQSTGEETGKQSLWAMLVDFVKKIIEWLYGNGGSAAGGCG